MVILKVRAVQLTRSRVISPARRWVALALIEKNKVANSTPDRLRSKYDFAFLSMLKLTFKIKTLKKENRLQVTIICVFEKAFFRR